MKIKLAHYTRKHDSGFPAIIETAAREAGIPDHEMLRVTTHFLTALVDHVSRGKIISIPGFGKFAACYIHPSNKKQGIMRARFAPSAGFVNQVRLCAPVSTKGNRALKTHIANHYNPNAQPSARTFIAMQRIREAIARQMAQD